MMKLGRVRNLMFRHSAEEGVVHNLKMGDIYPPPYSSSVALPSVIPEIFNAHGDRLEMFFLRDRHMAHDPYSLAAPPSHWLWDRYNCGLQTHFYSHWEMLKTMGSPVRRYGMLLESRSIVPHDYEIFNENQGLEKDFDFIFTFDEKILDAIGNSKFVPFCAVPWFGTESGGGILDESAFERKSKMVSILSSSKTFCDLHRFRLETARRCRREGLADAFGTFDGGAPVRISDTLTDYRYTIAIENDLSRYFFTERITSAFLSMTVPIYCGTSAIGEFFNEDGIIRLEPNDDLRRVLSQCSERDYESRIPALKDNFLRAQRYRNIWDLIHEQYLRI